MNRLPLTLCGVLGWLVLFCGFGAQVSAASSCVTEVLDEEMTAYAVFTKETALDYQLRQETELGALSDDDLDREKGNGIVLKKSTDITLPAGKVTARHSLKEPLEVQTKSGQGYRLLAGTDCSYTLPPLQSGYQVTVPKGASLVEKEGTTPPIYVLPAGSSATVTAPVNYQVALTVDAKQVVERIPGTLTGTLLTIKPQRAPMGEYVKLTVEKSGFAFNEAQFYVCLRKRDLPGPGKAPFIASKDVELKEVQNGKAVLQVRIPDIDESGAHFAKPVDLLVVARKADGTIAEVVSQEFSVSSRTLAVFCWIAAFGLPWLVAGVVSGRKEAGKGFRLDPIWFVSGKYGGASLSLAQILLWTVLVFSASFYVLVVSGKLLDLTDDVLVLLGIAGGSSVLAKIAASTKEEKGRDIAPPQPKDPKWLDLFRTDGRPDLYKAQMALFTALAVVFVTGKIYGTLEFPELPAGLLTLIGISNGVYLGAKATSKTVYEKLAEKHNELLQAEKALAKRQAEAAEAGKRQSEAQAEMDAAVQARDEAKEQLDKEQDAGQKVKYNELHEQRKLTARKAESLFAEAQKNKKAADSAVIEAEAALKKLKDDFETLKKEVTD